MSNIVSDNTVRAQQIDPTPPEQVEFCDSPHIIENYLSDEASTLRGEASGVFFPVDEGEASGVIRWACETGTPVTISAGGTGLTGARVPLGGVVLDTGKMTRVEGILENRGVLMEHETLTGQASIYLDSQKGRVVVAGGLPLEALMEIITPHGFIYPPNPTERSSLVGGNVATNASGGRSFKFGSVRKWVRCLRVILPTGELLEIPRGVYFADDDGFFSIEYPDGSIKKIPIPGYFMPGVKNASGLYSMPGMDLIDLFIGCEGILGVICQVELELVNTLGREIFGSIIFFGDDSYAVAFVKEVRDLSRDGKSIIDAMTIDYFDANSLYFMDRLRGGIPPGASGAVFVEQIMPEDCEPVMNAWAGLMEKYCLVDDWWAMDSPGREKLRLFRHSLPESINAEMRRRGQRKMGMDLAVPDHRLEDLLNLFRVVGGGTGVEYLFFGHIGDNNLHMNFLPKTEEEMKMVIPAYLTIAGSAVAMGGTVSGEHGVGKKQFPVNGEMTPYLGLMYGLDELCSIAGVKKSLDPAMILNRGNMIPGDILEKC